MPESVGLTAGVVIALFAVSFLFSGTETALFSLQKVDRQRLEREDGGGARVIALLQRRHALITTILIGNETANVALGAVGASIFAALAASVEHPVMDAFGPYLNILVLVPMLVLFSEITPKVIAYRFNTTWARAVAPPLSVFLVLVTPIRWVVASFVAAVSRNLFRVPAQATQEGLREEDLRALIDQGTTAGHVDERERELIEAVFDFDDLTVGRLMTPRPDVFAVPLEIEWPDLLKRCREAGFSRVPVYAGRSENVVGILIVKDLLKYRDTPLAGPRQLRTLLIPANFVPQSKPADDMLQEFMEQRSHMAFVVDEHGTLVGLVTLDDLLAELVGELLEREEEAGIEPIGPHSWSVRAWLDVDDFRDETQIALPEGDYHTVGGFVFHSLGRLPARGDVVDHDGWRFVVGGMHGRRIDQIVVRSLEARTDEQEAR